MLVFIDYAYLTVGGAPQLESNIILGLNKRGLTAKVYCSKKSYFFNRLTNLHADFIHIDSDEVSRFKIGDFISKEDVVCATNTASSLLFFLNRKKIGRLFFYSIHPDTFFTTKEWIKKIPLYKTRVFGLLNNLFKKDAIYFMDRPNVKGLTNRGYHLPLENIRFIPVPDLSESGLRRSKYTLDVICRVTYVGRGTEAWKVYPVVKLLEDLNKIDETFILTIITDSNEMFLSMINEFVPHNKVKIDFINGLWGRELEEYLYNNSDIHYSMGISALDGAKLGIPTILCDASHHKFPDSYKYKWLFEAKEYSLAEFIDGETLFEGHSMNDIIKSINDKNEYLEIANKCFHFVDSNHSLDRTVDLILDAANRTKMTALEYSRIAFVRRGLWISIVEKIKYEVLKIIKK